MLYIKTANIISSKQFFTGRHGAEAFHRALLSLNQADQDYVGGLGTLPSGWTPMDVWIRFHQVMIRELAGGQESVQVEAGQHNAERDLKGVHRVFLKMGTPRFIIRMARPLFNSYFKRDAGPLDITMKPLGRNHYECTMVGFESDHRLLELGVQGWLNKALEVSGGRRVEVELTGSVSNGAGRTVYRIQWD